MSWREAIPWNPKVVAGRVEERGCEVTEGPSLSTGLSCWVMLRTLAWEVGCHVWALEKVDELMFEWGVLPLVTKCSWMPSVVDVLVDREVWWSFTPRHVRHEPTLALRFKEWSREKHRDLGISLSISASCNGSLGLTLKQNKASHGYITGSKEKPMKA